MAKKFSTYEEALEAQVEGKQEVRDAKQALTAYLKENKLKRNVDYANDKKHGKKITGLQNSIDKASASLEKVNEAVTNLKPAKNKASKYDYPEGLTADEKKQFRQKARAGNKPAKEKKEKAPKANKAAKTEKAVKTSKKKKRSSKKND